MSMFDRLCNLFRTKPKNGLSINPRMEETNRFLNKYLLHKLTSDPCIFRFIYTFTNNDGSTKIFNHQFFTYMVLTDVKKDHVICPYCILVDYDNFKAFGVFLGEKSSVDTLNEAMVFRFILSNIEVFFDTIYPVYEEDLDLPRHFVVNINQCNIEDPLSGWKEDVMNKYRLNPNQVKDLLMRRVDTSDDNEEDGQSPDKTQDDVKIVRKPNGSISLYRLPME